MSLADSTGTSSVADESWVNWYCSLNGHGVLCEVDRQFIEDSFNLFGLKQYINKDFNKALATILDRNDNEPNDDMDLDRSAALLYGLIHARYIITTNGLNAMQKKFLHNEFGECPRAYCQNQPVLPVGLSDDPGVGCYKLFCPRCRELYQCPPSQRHVDGAYFGMSFAHIFLMTFDELVPTVPTTTYVPRVFGFKVHSSSNSMPKKIVVLDINSSASDASSSNNLNSSDNNNVDESKGRSKNKKSARNKISSPGPQVVYDLTSDPTSTAAALNAAASAPTSGATPGSNGNNRLSLQPPYHNIGHANSQHQYQHPQQDQHQVAELGQGVSRYSASPVQQEYSADAYYDALARHNTTKNGATHIIYSPNGFLGHQPPPTYNNNNNNNNYFSNGHEVDSNNRNNQSHNNSNNHSSSGMRRALSPCVNSGSEQEEQDPAKRPKIAQR